VPAELQLPSLVDPENRSDLAELVQAAGLDVREDLLDSLLRALAHGLSPERLAEGIRKLANSPADAPQLLPVEGAVTGRPTSARKLTKPAAPDEAKH